MEARHVDPGVAAIAALIRRGWGGRAAVRRVLGLWRRMDWAAIMRLAREVTGAVALLLVLTARHLGGAHVEELMQVTGWSRRTIFARISELRDAGLDVECVTGRRGTRYHVPDEPAEDREDIWRRRLSVRAA